MEEKDTISDKFKSAFADFEREPPERVWDHLRSKLHPAQKPENNRVGIFGYFLFSSRKPGFYLVSGMIVLLLFLTIVYISSGDHYKINGHAYTGEARLCGGTAVLFQVSDKQLPWDSATHYRSANIDGNGHYTFPKVVPGKYLLRIAPDEKSESAQKYLPSWFEQYSASDSCHLIIVDFEDVNADVHLIEKEN